MLTTLPSIDDISALFVIAVTVDKSVPDRSSPLSINTILLVPAKASASVVWRPKLWGLDILV